MDDINAAYEATIAKYKADAAERRKLSKTQVVANSPIAVQPTDGVITVPFGEDVKPLSVLGGVVEVPGHSRINIPEFKLRQS